MGYTEKEILKEIDLAFKGIPSPKFPSGDIRYNFFLDLEHGYCETANSKIHLYADKDNWAIILEKSGYQNRGKFAVIELNYIGNCIDYPSNKSNGRIYITNTKSIFLITTEEFYRIENKSGTEMEQFELIDNSITEVKIREELITVELNSEKYDKLGINLREENNSRKLIGFSDLIRFFRETNSEIITAKEEEIKSQIPNNLQKIMTINEFHHLSIYEEKLPSQSETYQLIANVLINRDSSIWKPKLCSNNHWSNWESGHL